MNPPKINLKETALVLIDLQQGIVGLDLAPHSGAKVVEHAAKLADRFRQAKAPVVLVRVTFSPDGADALKAETDFKPNFQRPANWAEFVPAIGPKEGDIVITKRQWGAFYGTDLDLQLRRRGQGTIVICGISTEFGVESTARDAYERGYELIFAEDAMTGMTAESHVNSTTRIFPRLGRVRATEEILAALAG